MPVFFNNCRGRDHAGLFGAGAFYDLNRTGREPTMATNLKRGDGSVVATPGAGGDIVFSWFSFSHEAVMPAEEGTRVRVPLGAHECRSLASGMLARVKRPLSLVK